MGDRCGKIVDGDSTIARVADIESFIVWIPGYAVWFPEALAPPAPAAPLEVSLT